MSVGRETCERESHGRHMCTHTHTYTHLVFRSVGERLSKQMRQHTPSHAAVPTDPLTLISVTFLQARECVRRLLVCRSDVKPSACTLMYDSPSLSPYPSGAQGLDEHHDCHPSLFAGISFQHPRRKAKIC